MNEQIEKMHAAKRKARDAEIWKYVKRSIATSGCHCDLHEGMIREDLPHGSGCKDRYVCPALDTYRRLLPPPPVPEDELALQESA